MADRPTSEIIQTLRTILCSEEAPLARRFRALFSLKHIAAARPTSAVDFSPAEAVRAIAAAFGTPSDLLKHELAYCLGQTGNPASAPFLRARLEDVDEAAICRHEAAEALAALGDVDSLPLLRQMRDDDKQETVVRETCDIAVARLEWQQSEERNHQILRESNFTSVDPAPPLPKTSEVVSIPDLERTMLDRNLPLFQRYRAMFSLRDLCSPPDEPTAIPAIKALARGLDDPSALFRHEIAFVFGQLSHPASIPALLKALSNRQEEGMVRHEAAEALGSLGAEEGVEDMLKQYAGDEEEVVRESIVVALDMAEFERNGELEYTLLPDFEKSATPVVPASA